jgi:diadenosine tetraphosphatase ApaH/serine/threonine PP2A family protein phosphatase
VAYLILSDIHGNLEALSAVLADADGRYERVLCLGDLVGYGADPNAVVEWSRQHVSGIVRGNHDKACAGADPLDDYNPAARDSAEWTRRVLTPESAAYLSALPIGPASIEADTQGELPFDISHGSPLNEDEYLVVAADVWPLRSALAARLTFFGHTHMQGGFLLTRGGVKRIRGAGIVAVEPEHHFLINPGSVGQPRDGDPKAAYAIYDADQRLIEYRRTEYDIDSAAAKIRAAGLPEVLAARLYQGQ